MAAKPIPGAAYIVSNISSINDKVSSSIIVTGSDIVFNKGLGTVIISLIVILLDKL